MGQQGAEQQGGQVEARGRGGAALLARLAARVLAQHPLELRRAHALLVLVARPAVLAQEHLLVAHVDCEGGEEETGR